VLKLSIKITVSMTLAKYNVLGGAGRGEGNIGDWASILYCTTIGHPFAVTAQKFCAR
jgi:hypothetical protein